MDDIGGISNISNINSYNDDIQWINIQDPIKQMITSITKAVRTQSAGIRDLDRKIGLLLSSSSSPPPYYYYNI